MTDEQEFYKVFCGNFEYECELSEMERLFEKYGEFDHIDMKTGFCFVYFKHKSDGQASIDDLDGIEYGKARRRLKLEWAKGDGRIKLREERRRANITPNSTLFVVNFDPAVTSEDDFSDEFGRFGALERVQLKKNFAFIQYKDLEDAKDALAQMNGSMLKGRKITVEYVATTQEDRGRDRSPPPRRYEPRDRYERDRYDRDRYDRDRHDRDYDREAYLRGPSSRDSYRDRSPPRRRDYSPDRRRRMPSPRPYRRERSPLPYRRRSRS